jgi:hypothetical protein
LDRWQEDKGDEERRRRLELHRVRREEVHHKSLEGRRVVP